MINLMKYKWLFFGVSLIVIIPGIVSLVVFGLKQSIDFTGGTLMEIQNNNIKTQSDIARAKDAFVSRKIEVASVQTTNTGTYLFRTKPMDKNQETAVLSAINSDFGKTDELRFETVGPTIGAELTTKAFQAVLIASIMIVIYIAYAFREIPKPYSPWKFGFAAVAALLHDVLVVIGLFSIFGHLFNAEIDTLFVTALLTVIGFSVHDTIVVFDRVRENLRKDSARKTFTEVVNESLLQTLVRSLNTSLTVLLTLLALVLFGGETIRWFVIALFIGIFSGTYSSIFNAAPLLVLWEEKSKK